MGIQIAKAEKAVGLRVDNDGNWNVSFESGKIVKARYVLGADGARSMVSCGPVVMSYHPRSKLR
jgi:flavin-dependent dehydrogenase